MSLIYHYCTLDTFVQVIKNKTIRMSDLNKTNDYLEKTWGKRFLYDTLCEELEKNNIQMNLKEGYWYSDEAHTHLEQLQNDIDRMLKHQTLITCFSKDRDKLSQWRAYANDGSGIAIGFDLNYLRKMVKNSQNFYIGEVVYKKDKQKKIIREEVYAPAFQYMKNFFQHDMDKVYGDFNTYFVEEFDIFCEIQDNSEQIFCFLKNPAFEEEHEVRMVYNTGIYEDIEMEELKKLMLVPHEFGKGKKKLILKPMEVQLKGEKLVMYADLNFEHCIQDGIIKEIVIGPKAEITDHDIQQLLCVNGFDDIIIRKSDASYQ